MNSYGTAVMVPLAAILYFLAYGQAKLAYGNEYVAGLLRSVDLKSVCQSPLFSFNLLFLFVLFLRYARLVVHIYAKYVLYKPTPVLGKPRYLPKDVHVIVPTVDPENADFRRCIESIIAQAPGAVTIATAQEHWKQTMAEGILDTYAKEYPHIKFGTVHSVITNKRAQIVTVLDALFKDAESREANKDKILVLVDDHVWWPSKFFFANLLAPFEDDTVGLVGTNKRPERDYGNSFSESLRNLIACAYLERHNFDVVTTNAIDGGAFVISARTCAIRAAVCMSEEFRHGFTNEYFWTPWGRVGPLNPDDDNYITRYAMKKGWKIKFQCGEDAIMQTTLGTTGGWTKFRGQIIRWARSQWRSNSCSILRDAKTTWTRHPWTALVYYTGSMFNFAVVWDPLIVYTWHKSSYDFPWYCLVGVMLGSKLIKLWPLFKHNPCDILMWPLLILFGYLHSFIKFYALLTFWDAAWGGRNLEVASTTTATGNDAQEPDGSNGSDSGTLGHSDSGTVAGSDNSAPHSRGSPNASSRSSSSSSTGSQRRRRPVNIVTDYLSTSNSAMSAVSQDSAPMLISDGPSPVSLMRRSPMSHLITNPRSPRFLSVSEGFTSPPYKLSSEFLSRGSHVFDHQASTSSTSSFSIGNGSSNEPIVQTIKRLPIDTPWGPVTPSNTHLKPANLNMSFTDLSASSRSASSKTHTITATPTPMPALTSYANTSQHRFPSNSLPQLRNNQVSHHPTNEDAADPYLPATNDDNDTTTPSPPQTNLPPITPPPTCLRKSKSMSTYTRTFHRRTTSCARLHSSTDSVAYTTPSESGKAVHACLTPKIGDAGAPIVSARTKL